MRKFWAKFELNLLKYGLAAVLISIPLYPKFPSFAVPGTYVSVRLEDFLIAFLALTWLIALLRGSLKSKIPKVLLVGIGLYLAITALSTLSAVFVTHTVMAHIALLHFLRRLEYMVPFFLASTVIKDRTQLYFYLEVIFWTVVAVAIYGLGQIYLRWPVISTQNYEFAKGFALHLTPGARLNSTFAGHYDLASYAVLMAPLFLALVVAGKRFLKFMGFIGISIILWLLLASSSRISFPSYLFAGTFFLFFAKKKFALIPYLLVSLLLMATTTELASRYLRTIDVYLKPIASLITIPRDDPTEPPFQVDISPTPAPFTTAPGSPGVIVQVTPVATPTRRPKIKTSITPTPPTVVIIEERSTEIRLNAEWPRALRAFYKNPLLGTGFSSITLATDNDYLRAIGEVGILGSISFLLILYLLVKKPLKNLKQKPENLESYLSLALLSSILGFAINATFIDVFEASKAAITFWALAGIFVWLTYEKN